MHAIDPPSYGDDILWRGRLYGVIAMQRSAANIAYTPSTIYVCSRPEVPVLPDTNCSAYGFQYQLQFGTALRAETLPWAIPDANDTASVLWPFGLGQFYWNSTAPVGALIFSELGPDGNVTTTVRMLKIADGLGAGTIYDGREYGEVVTTVDPATGDPFRPQVIYMCSYRPRAPAPNCSDYGFAYEIAFDASNASQTQAWPDSNDTAEVRWPRFPSLEYFLWRSEAPVSAIILTEGSTIDALTRSVLFMRFVGDDRYGVGAQYGGIEYGNVTAPRTAENSTEFVPETILMCASAPVFFPNTTCADLGYKQQVAFDTEDDRQRREWDWPNSDFAAYLVWPLFPTLEMFLWRSDIPVGVIIVSEVTRGGDNSTNIMTIDPESTGHGTTIQGIGFGNVSIASDRHPSMVYMCSNTPIYYRPNTNCTDYGYQYQLVFTPAQDTETLPWPGGDNTATVAWPQWGRQIDHFIWRSTAAVGMLIYSERSPADHYSTIVMSIKWEEAYGKGWQYNGEEYGMIELRQVNGVPFEPQMVYLCSHRPQYLPNTTCADLGYTQQVAFDAEDDRQRREWSWPNTDFAAYLAWPLFPALEYFYWRSDINVSVIIVSEVTSSGNETTVHSLDPASLGVGYPWYGDEYGKITPQRGFPSIVYMCSNVPIYTPPKYNCSEFGYLHQLAFVASQQTSTQLWEDGPDSATVTWPQWDNQLDYFLWCSTAAVGALIFSERSPANFLFTTVRIISEGEAHGVGSSYNGEEYGRVELDSDGGIRFTPQVIYMCSHRPMFVPNSTCEDLGFDYGVTFGIASGYQYQHWDSPSVDYRAHLAWPLFPQYEHFLWRSGLPVGMIIVSEMTSNGDNITVFHSISPAYRRCPHLL